MPTWTFTTTDPDTALKLSTFCIGLGHVTETKTETETPDKPAPVQRRPTKPPVDHGCWRDPEARKVRAKALAWGNKVTRNAGRDGRFNDASDYADAMGWSCEKAEAKIEAHKAHLAANPTEYRW